MGYAGKDFLEKISTGEKRRRRYICLRRSWFEVCSIICRLGNFGK